jgi:hypothetical protein
MRREPAGFFLSLDGVIGNGNSGAAGCCAVVRSETNLVKQGKEQVISKAGQDARRSIQTNISRLQAG